MNELIMCKCKKCNSEFYIKKKDFLNPDKEYDYLACPFDDSRDIHIVKKYDDYKSCMDDKKIYKRENGRVKQQTR